MTQLLIQVSMQGLIIPNTTAGFTELFPTPLVRKRVLVPRVSMRTAASSV